MRPCKSFGRGFGTGYFSTYGRTPFFWVNKCTQVFAWALCLLPQAQFLLRYRFHWLRSKPVAIGHGASLRSMRLTLCPTRLHPSLTLRPSTFPMLQAQNRRRKAEPESRALQARAVRARAVQAQSSSSQSSTSSQTSAQQPDTPETKRQKAEEQMKEQEHQRMAGIVPSFNVTYHSDAVSLTPGEKFRLEFHAAIDPYTFGIAMVVAGLGEANDSDTGYGWGPGGYAKRAAAAYADNVIGNTLGNAVLPSILHQDPRYYRLGHGLHRPPPPLCCLHFVYLQARQHRKVGAQLFQRCGQHAGRRNLQLICSRRRQQRRPDNRNRFHGHRRGYVRINARGVLAGYFAETLPQRSNQWPRCAGAGTGRCCKTGKAAGRESKNSHAANSG